MRDLDQFPRVKLGVFPTPLYRLEAISAKYGRNIWIKRDDLCGVALGGNKVRKLEYLLAQAQTQGCDTVFTTGGAQSNHAISTRRWTVLAQSWPQRAAGPITFPLEVPQLWAPWGM